MTSAPPQKRFTAGELAAGDGREGHPVLVGYKGQVYDCTPSKLWKNGKHVNAHMAGHDLTAEMAAAPHADDVMARFPVVGLLPLPEPVAVAKTHEAPPSIELLLAQHPHPMTVHAPTAMGSFAAFFILLHYALGGPSALLGGAAGTAAQLSRAFDNLSAWLVLVTALTAPVGTATGLLSWWFNYRGVLTPLYRWKIGLSALLVVLAVGAAVLRLTCLCGFLAADYYPAAPVSLHWLYFTLVVALAPTVISLGRLGGEIVYP